MYGRCQIVFLCATLGGREAGHHEVGCKPFYLCQACQCKRVDVIAMVGGRETGRDEAVCTAYLLPDIVTYAKHAEANT